MDLAYWNFRHWPFDRTFAADRFFASDVHEEAMSRLLFLIEEFHRCGIILGPSGTGKTYLLKLVQQRAERLGRIVVRCEGSGVSADEIIANVATVCHVPSDAQATPASTWNGLRSRLAAMALVRQPLVLLVDHCGRVETGSLHTNRRLHLLADNVGLQLTTVLATSEPAVPAALQDMVDLRIELPSWSARETSQFIHTATDQAGSKKKLFTDEAVMAIQQITQGIPAKIVSLGNLSLLAARAQDETLVTREVVEVTASEFLPHASQGTLKPRVSSTVSSRNGRRNSVTH